MELDNTLFKGDKYIWGIYFILLFISVVEIFSATSTLAYRATEHYNPAFQHTTYLILGTLAVLIIHNMPSHYFRAIGTLAFPVSVVLLLLVMFTPEVNGAQRRIFGFQPSEIAKFAEIVVVCNFLAKGQASGGISKKSFYMVIGSAGIICGLILPENFSTAFLLGAVIFFLMFIAGVQWKRLGAILGTIAVIGALFLSVLIFVPQNVLPGRMKTWKSRIEQSKNTVPLVEQKLDNKNMQVQYGRMAVANGGIIGKFPGNSQIRDFLPQAYSDYIYSIIIEEMGILGGIFVLFLYFLLLFRAVIIFRQCKNTFPALLLLGLTMLIVFQALINMAVGVDLIPVTGQPLPLISRGGTSTLLTCGYFGILLSISRSALIDEMDYNDDHRLGEDTPEEDILEDQHLIPETTGSVTGETVNVPDEKEEYSYTDIERY